LCFQITIVDQIFLPISATGDLGNNGFIFLGFEVLTAVVHSAAMLMVTEDATGRSWENSLYYCRLHLD
jgi:hypothetical protein